MSDIYRWQAGEHLTVAGPNGVLLLDPQIGVQLAEKAFGEMQRGATLGALLQLLTNAYDLWTIPPFVLALHNAGDLQVVVRGPMHIRISSADGEEHMSGKGVSTWTERLFERVSAFSVSWTEHVDGPTLPVTSAVLWASSISWGQQDKPPAAAQPSFATAVPDASPLPTSSGSPAGPGAPVQSGKHQAPLTGAREAGDIQAPIVRPLGQPEPKPQAPAEPDPESDPAAVDAEPADQAPADTTPEPAEDGAAHAPGPLTKAGIFDQAATPDSAPADPPKPGGSIFDEPADDAPEDDTPEATSPDAPEPRRSSIFDEPVSSSAGADAPAPPSLVKPASEPVKDSLFDGPSPADEPGQDAAGPEPTAVFPVTPAAGPGRPRTGSETLPEVDWEVNSDAPAGRPDTPAKVLGGPVWGAPGEDAAQSTPDEPEWEGAHGGDTMSSPNLGSKLGKLLGTPRDEAEPTVLALVCENGHPSPPQTSFCSECGHKLTGPPKRVPRPSLGLLTMPDGEVVVLMQSVIVGRSPSSERSSTKDQPRLITVSSPNQEISRSHVEICLEGWSVLARDLGSSNGTLLVRQGDAPVKLPETSPLQLHSGDVLDLGEGVRLSLSELP